MHVVIINPPYRNPEATSEWLTLPPQGYGGIQWMVTNLIDGLVELGCCVSVLGAPGSRATHRNVKFYDVVDRLGVNAFLQQHHWDIVHDHTNGVCFDPAWTEGGRFVGTHHLTGAPLLGNCIFCSEAQAIAASQPVAPVIRIPVNLERYPLREEKDEYLLFMGRVSPWKGTREAAAFAKSAGRMLLVAGPTWEEDYANDIQRDFTGTVKFLGSCKGAERLDLIQRATAMMVLSQAVPGPWGHKWCEPGSTVVSEAAACGTPVIASKNGCLLEIAPRVGVCLNEEFDHYNASEIVSSLPLPRAVRTVAREEWDHRLISKQYLDLYEKVLVGLHW